MEKKTKKFDDRVWQAAYVKYTKGKGPKPGPHPDPDHEFNTNPTLFD